MKGGVCRSKRMRRVRTEPFHKEPGVAHFEHCKACCWDDNFERPEEADTAAYWEGSSKGTIGLLQPG